MAEQLKQRFREGVANMKTLLEDKGLCDEVHESQLELSRIADSIAGAGGEVPQEALADATLIIAEAVKAEMAQFAAVQMIASVAKNGFSK